MNARLAIQPSDFAYAVQAFKWPYHKPVASRASQPAYMQCAKQSPPEIGQAGKEKPGAMAGPSQSIYFIPA